MNKIRTIKLYKSYFKEFYIALPKGVRDKINYSLYMVETMKIIPSKFFKNIVGTNGLYEKEVNIAAISIGYYVVWIMIL